MHRPHPTAQPLLTRSLLASLLAALALALAACSADDLTPPPPSADVQAPADAGAAGSGDTAPESQAIPEDAGPELAARVNGEPITLEAFERELARFEAGQAALGFEAADPNAVRLQVLNVMIDNELLRQQAEAEGITVSDEAVDARMDSIVEEFGEDYFTAWLQQNQYTPEEMREQVRLEMLVEQVIPTLEELVPNAAEHVHARHILVNTREQAEAALARLESGEAFETVAAEVNTDSSRELGGDLGWFPRGGLMLPEVEEAAFSLQPGETSGIVESVWGLHIVQTLERDPAREMDIDTRQRLAQPRQQQWLEDLRANADIENFLSPPS